jgi:hypothetical protein
MWRKIPFEQNAETEHFNISNDYEVPSAPGMRHSLHEAKNAKLGLLAYPPSS